MISKKKMNKFLKTYKEFRWREIVIAGKPHKMEPFEMKRFPEMYIEARRVDNPKHVATSMAAIVHMLIDNNPSSIGNLKPYLKYLNSYNMETILTKFNYTFEYLKEYLGKLNEHNIVRLATNVERLYIFDYYIKNVKDFSVSKLLMTITIYAEEKDRKKLLDKVRESGILNRVKDTAQIKSIVKNDELKDIHDDLLNTLTDEERTQVDMFF